MVGGKTLTGGQRDQCGPWSDIRWGSPGLSTRAPQLYSEGATRVGAQGHPTTGQSQTRWARGPVGQAGHSSPLSAPPPKSQTHF